MESIVDHSKLRTRCKKKFLRYFPKGFVDEKYLQWERNYKWEAHVAWEKVLNKYAFLELIEGEKYNEIAKLAVNIETKTNLLFSFEKMALRDAVKSGRGAKAFALGLFDYVYGAGDFRDRFENFAETLDRLPRKQTRVRTWPLQTVFGFIADPKKHIFLKPRVTQIAAENYGYDFHYSSKPNWETYQSLLGFAKQVKKDNAELKPKDMIDLQSFIWVMGSDEY
jgi:hypothetical protein